MVNIDGLGLTGGAVVFSTRRHRRNALLVRPNASVAHRSKLNHRLAGILDEAETIGDSDTIIAHLIRKYSLAIDAGLTQAQRDTTHMITRMLDDLYWVMSYSRWQDQRFWPLFRHALLKQHPSLTEAGTNQGAGI
jgi:Glutathione S-transferase N-terminal domain